MTTASDDGATRPGAPWPLLALNFFMADMQAGIGPFLGVFLLAHGWDTGPIGTVMTLGGLSALIVTLPAGALVDATRWKRLCIILPGVATVLASGLVLVSQNPFIVAGSQMGSAVAGALIGPAVNGITLGLVRQAGFRRQLGRNQVFNHAGNVTGAALSGLLGWAYGFSAVFWLAAAFGVLSIGSVLLIAPEAIDHAAARGEHAPEAGKPRIGGWSVLLSCRPLLVLAGALACFHLGNAAMLPIFGLAVVAAKQGNPAGFVATTIVVAQLTMIGAALLASHLAERWGYWPVLLISFVALPIRGLLAAYLIVYWGVFPVQMLDGVGAGLQGVAVPGLVAEILNGTGRVNVGLGAVMAVQGIGAALSPALGGWLAQTIGYPPTFVILGAFALGSIAAALWILRDRIELLIAGSAPTG